MVTVCLPHSRDSLPSFKVLFCRLSYLHLFCFTIGSVILLIFSDLLPAITMTWLILLTPRKSWCQKSHGLAPLLFSLFCVVLLVKLACKSLGFFPLKITNTSLQKQTFVCFSQATVFLVFRILLKCGPSPSGQRDLSSIHQHHLLWGRNKTIK